MKIHDLNSPYPEMLFSTDKIDQWKRGALPKRWFDDQYQILLARCQEIADAVERGEISFD